MYFPKRVNLYYFYDFFMAIFKNNLRADEILRGRRKTVRGPRAGLKTWKPGVKGIGKERWHEGELSKN